MSRKSKAYPQQPDAYLSIPAMDELRSFRQAPSPSSLTRARQRIVDDGRVARTKIDSEIDALRAIIARSDPLHLHGALHMWDVRARGVLSGPQLHGSDALLEFFAGLVTSLPEQDAIANLGGSFDPQTVLDAENQLRVIGQAQAAIDFADAYSEPPKSPIDGAVRLLNLERHFDRMSGFGRHLRHIADALFEIVDDRALTTLGFKFSDALRFADIYDQGLLQHWQDTSLRIRAEHTALPADAKDDERMQWIFSDMLSFVLDAAAPVETGASEIIANEIGMTTETFNLLVNALSTPLGSQQVVDLHGDNRVRTHPILSLSSGGWQWCRPADFIHSIFDWAFEESSRNPQLLRAFDKARQLVAERIPTEILQSVFGTEAVFANVTYPAEQSDAEADAVVCVPGAHLIVECKGGRITNPARRGAPKRVEKHAEDIVVKGADQNLRAAQAIKAKLPLRDPRGRSVPVRETDVSLSLIVTLDRIDPFNTLLGEPSTGDITDRSWIVTLADLLLIADILPNSAEFFAYARTRVEMVRADSHRVIVEADALGAWCKDRLTTVKPIFPGTFSLIDETSTEINDYYAYDTAVPDDEGTRSPDQRKVRLTAGVPTAVLAGLGRLFATRNEHWLQRCEQALDVRPVDWKHFNLRIRLAENPDSATSRIARKKLAQAHRGFTVAGLLPVRFESDSAATSEDYLLIHL